MAKNINKDNIGNTLLPAKRAFAEPIDIDSYFDSFNDADSYARTNPLAYVGQLLTVKTTTGICYYKIANTGASSASPCLKPIYDEENIATAGIENIGFMGELPEADEHIPEIKKGYQYVLTRDIYDRTTPIANAGDYFVYNGERESIDMPADDGWDSEATSNWVILEQNLTHAITAVTPSVPQNNKVVTKIKQNGHILEVTYDDFPEQEIRSPYLITKTFVMNPTSEYEYTLEGTIDLKDDIEAVLEIANQSDKLCRAFDVKLNGVGLDPEIEDPELGILKYGDYSVKLTDNDTLTIRFVDEVYGLFDEHDVVSITWNNYKTV